PGNGPARLFLRAALAVFAVAAHAALRVDLLAVGDVDLALLGSHGVSHGVVRGGRDEGVAHPEKGQRNDDDDIPRQGMPSSRGNPFHGFPVRVTGVGRWTQTDRPRRRRRSASSRTQRSRSSPAGEDRKSTRLNSSHVKISYAVFCWK